MNKVNILTPKGVGEIENTYVSDLGFLMLRINNLDGTYTTYNLGKHNVDVNIFTNQIVVYETVGSSRD
jgi:hypothetical protein